MPRLVRSRVKQKADNVPVRRSARHSTPNAPLIEIMEDSDRSRSKTVEDERPTRWKQTKSRRVPEDSDDEPEEENWENDDQGQDDDDDMNVDQDEDEDEEEEDQEDELSSSPSEKAPPAKGKAAAAPRLKITLKVPGGGQATTTPTPSDEMPLKPSRKGHTKHAEIESEDDDDDEDSSRSNSIAAPTRLTQRQAALAGMVEAPGHLVLEETVSKKKKLLNEAELALKREETARKRKNLSVKKLEDEKTETINRLLKKQSRRGKKAAPVDDEDAEQDAEDVVVTPPVQIIPTSFRWVSSSKPDSSFLSFSVPQSLIETLGSSETSSPQSTPEPKPKPTCDFAGCAQPRKYKLVRDPSKGGCGMEHLKALQAAL